MKSSWARGIDVAAIEAAIRSAERQTSGEIRVVIARFHLWGDVLVAAARAFRRLHMDRTRLHNGVLLYLVPTRRRFAIFGDVGIHDHVGPAFWSSAAEQLKAAFASGDLTNGIERTIANVGQRLAGHFPPDPSGDVNELPDAVVRRP